MSQHQRGQRTGLECSECNGRSFTDPTKEFHWPDCSKYHDWRFGPARVSAKEKMEAVAVRRSLCPHGLKDWTECPNCTSEADFDAGWE